MKYCPRCGTQLFDGALICPRCQTPVSYQPSYQFTPQNFYPPTNYQPKTQNFQTNPPPKKPDPKKPIVIAAAIAGIVAICIVAICIIVICLKKIPYKSFDIKDEELIETLDELGVDVSFSTLKHNDLDELDGFDRIDTDTTIYRITALDETGILVLSHGFSGHIRCIMVCFDDHPTAIAVISALASELDYSFSTSKAMNSVLLDEEIYTSDKYTVMKKDLSSELSGIFLTPKEHFEFSVKSVLSN